MCLSCLVHILATPMHASSVLTVWLHYYYYYYYHKRLLGIAQPQLAYLAEGSLLDVKGRLNNARHDCNGKDEAGMVP